MELISMFYHLIIELILIYPIPAAVLIGLPVLALLVALFSRNKDWRGTKTFALVLASLTGIVAFFLLPGLFKSSLSEMRYYVDWLFHIGYVLATVIYVFFITWFLLASIKKKPY